MSLRYQSQLQIDLLPDEQTNNKFEVIMPSMNLIQSSSSNNLGSGGLLNALEKVVTAIPGLFTYYPIVESITFSPQAFNTSFTRINTYYWGYPQDQQSLKNVNITFFLDVGNLAMYYLEAWKSLMFNKEAEYYYPPQRYKKDIVVFFYGLSGALPSAIYFLRGCFPIETSPFELAYSKDPKRLTITQTFSVDRVEYEKDRAWASIMSVLGSGNPLGIVTDQALAMAQEYTVGLSGSMNMGGDLLRGFGI